MKELKAVLVVQWMEDRGKGDEIVTAVEFAATREALEAEWEKLYLIHGGRKWTNIVFFDKEGADEYGTENQGLLL